MIKCRRCSNRIIAIILLMLPVLCVFAMATVAAQRYPPGDLTTPFGVRQHIERVHILIDEPGVCVDGNTLSGFPVHVCFAPGTPSSYIRLIMSRFYGDFFPAYNIFRRWTITATNANTGTSGTPVTLTWSYVPDGVMIPGGEQGVGEPASPNNLFATLDSQFGGNRALWQSRFQQVFDRWQEVCGIRYIHVPDDGAALPNSPGQLGSRGDVRIAGHSIDGPFGILAYNFLPNGGDMILDTDENWNDTANSHRRLRNTISHEHGHGMGLLHVLPRNDTKLMEARLVLDIDGPQDDDIRGAQRMYGDRFERNDTPGTATPVPAGTDVTITDASLDRLTDQDWWRFAAGANQRVTLIVNPVGSAYSVSPDPGEPLPIDTRAIINLDLELRNSTGANLLTSAAGNGVGQSERINKFALPAAGGTFLARVLSGSGSQDDVQRYRLRVRLALRGDVNGNGCVDDADLLSVLFAFGQTGADLLQDLNGDGIVDDADLLDVLFHFGAGC